LCVCSSGYIRNIVATELLVNYGYIAESFELHDNTMPQQIIEKITWADIIIVMEQHNAIDIQQKYENYVQSKPIYVANIPDVYANPTSPLLKMAVANAVLPIMVKFITTKVKLK
jgi:predicted protein tyrosine phosphatase